LHPDLPGRVRGPIFDPVALSLVPRQILDERYAKGDLTPEEYLEWMKHVGLS